jgi:hypothetical protein
MAQFGIIDGDGRGRRGQPGEKFADGERAVFRCRARTRRRAS